MRRTVDLAHPTVMIRWRVLRLDDNGNTFLIAEVASELEADAIARAFEARGHKQLYFVERVAPALSPAGDGAAPPTIPNS